MDLFGLHIDLSPTYSGCPALDVIPVMVREELAKHGIHVEIGSEEK